MRSREKGSSMMTHNKSQHNENLVQQILCEQDLSRAGNIFSLNSQQLLSDFPKTIEILKTIIDNRNYVFNLNEQTIVEIVLTKCLSALRESQLLAEFYDDLLDLIEICLKYDLNNRRKSVILTSPTLAQSATTHGAINVNDDNSFLGNSNAHANVISDIFSSILLEYLNPELAMKTIPTCIKLIQHSNVKPELTREVCCYLSLIANRMPELLVDYVYYIVNAIKIGHTSLTYLLFQISEINIDCMYPFVRLIIKMLDKIDSAKDFGYLLQVMYLISLNHIQLFIVHLEDLMKYLNNKNYEEHMLDIIFSVASQMPIELDLYLNMLDNERFLSSYKVDKILGTVGKSLKRKAELCTCMLINRLKWNLKSLRKPTKQASNRHSYCPSQNEKHSKRETYNGIDHMIDLIHLRQPITSHMSRNRKHYEKSHSYSPNVQTEKTSNESKICDEPFKHETRLEAGQDDDEKQIEECMKRCFSVLSEIYDIAQSHPHVLDTNLKTIKSLLAYVPDCLASLLHKIEELQMENSSMSFPSKTCSKNSNKSESCGSYILDYEPDLGETHDDLDLAEGATRTFLENNFFEMSRREFDTEERRLAQRYLLDIVERKQQKPARTEGQEDDEEMARLNKGETLRIAMNNANVYEISRLDNSSSTSKSNEDEDIDKLEDVSFKCAIPNQQQRDYSDNIEDYQDMIDDVDELGPLPTRIGLKKLRFHESKDQTDETQLLINNSAKEQDKSGLNRHDLVEQFCTKHAEKIKLFANKLSRVLPRPSLEAMLETKSSPIRSDSLRQFRKNEKKDLLPFKCANKKLLSLKFNCACQGPYCLFSKNYFRFRTNHVSAWIHCMFLLAQSEMSEPLNQNHGVFAQLKRVYERFNEKFSFNTLVTSSFPGEKQINEMVNELNKSQYFDLFNSIAPNVDSIGEKQSMWCCCLCSNPDCANSLLDEKPLLKGELKEKHGKLKFLRRWNKRMFTLIDGNIVYFKKDMRQESLNVKYIRTIQPLKATSSIAQRKERTNSKAFEIFTNRNSFILKAENSADAQQWMHYLHLLKALEDNRSNE